MMSTDKVICPYCKNKHIIDEYDLYEEGSHLLECVSCEEEFIVNTSVTYNFEAECTKDKHQDVIEQKGENKLAICMNCDNYRLIWDGRDE